MRFIEAIELKPEKINGRNGFKLRNRITKEVYGLFLTKTDADKALIDAQRKFG